MQILLANAKLMHSAAPMEPQTEPLFQAQANEIAAELARMDVSELARQLDCSPALALENWRRYQAFPAAGRLPALLAYNGQAYKHLQAASLSPEALDWGQQHVWVTCFLYGLLRPLDGIAPYRMEHTARLPQCGGKQIGHYWRDRLTDYLIGQVRADDGVLLHLSTAEYEQLFHWRRICEAVRVVQPHFYVEKDGRLRMQAVWAKSGRGAMLRYALERRILHVDELQGFTGAGFSHAPELGEPDHPHFVRRA